MSNWSKLDYFLPMALVSEANALIDLKGGKVATNNGATKVFEGFTIPITGKVEANFVAIDGLVKRDDIEFGAFVFNNSGTISSTLLGAGTSHTWLRQNSVEGIDYRASRAISRYLTSEVAFVNKTNYAVSRIAQAGLDIHKDGVATNAVAGSNADPSINPWVIGDALAFEGTVSLFATGRGIGVDQVAKNDHYREFLTDLGLNLDPIYAKLAGATLEDTLQGNTNLDVLKSSGARI